jgi:hypothetical protein
MSKEELLDRAALAVLPGCIQLTTTLPPPGIAGAPPKPPTFNIQGATQMAYRMAAEFVKARGLVVVEELKGVEEFENDVREIKERTADGGGAVDQG